MRWPRCDRHHHQLHVDQGQIPPGGAAAGAHERQYNGLLSREQAWSLAHASEHVATTHGEMVDPWDADQ